MDTAPPPKIADSDVFALTPRGQSQLKDGRTSLSADQLKVLVLVDGKSTAGELMRGMPVLSPTQVRERLEELLSGGLINNTRQREEDLAYIDPGDFFKTIGKPVRLTPAAEGHPEASAGLSSLQESGYYVSIARPATRPLVRTEGHRPTALVVDDDEDIGNLLSTFLRFENFETIVARNKAEVLAALRQPIPPDLALLDVHLPDVDGFHILSRMRQHPALRSVPIIMLTASATRADVLKGLHFGADGYVTKPFEFEVLMKAVRTVLGMENDTPKNPA
jgi:CheY-like chemotaxis protein